MNLRDILTEDDIQIPLTATSKNEIIKEMVEILFTNKKIQEKEKISQALFEREELMSTGVGDGVAIPHAKAEGITKISAVFGLTKDDVDFQSLDSKPVRIIFLLIGPINQPGPHLKALSRISRLLHQAEFRKKLILSGNPKEALRTILDEEKKYFD